MTNKRASEILYHQWQSFLEKNLDYGGVSEAYKKAFKALEQESILDKIRTEIEEYKSKQLTLAFVIGFEDLEKGKQEALEYVLAIFDKYKAESEVLE